MVVVLVAEPCANTPKEIFSLCMGNSPIHRQLQQQLQPPAPRRPTRWPEAARQSLAKHFRPVPSTPHTYCLSLLTQARIPS